MDESRYGHYLELVEAGNAYLKGEIGVGLFEETVNRIVSYIREGLGQFNAIELPEDASAELKKDFKLAADGFSLFQEGLDKIKLFLDEKDKDVLWQGLCMVKLGCDFLNEVMNNHEMLDDDDDGNSSSK